MSKPEDTYNRDGLECPHCHKVNRDAFELSPDAECGETECGHCEKPVVWVRHITVTYTGKAKK